MSPTAVERSSIWDGPVDGYRYFAIVLPEGSSFEGGITSFRSVVSEVLCLPVVRCLLPSPRLRLIFCMEAWRYLGVRTAYPHLAIVKTI